MLLLINPVISLDLMLSKVVWTVLVLAGASWVRALVDRRGLSTVLQLLVLGDAPLEPLRVTFWSVAADIAEFIRRHVLSLSVER